MLWKIPFRAERRKGPPTPNFGKFSEMLHSRTFSKGKFNVEIVESQHEGVGTKIEFVCVLLENIQGLEQKIATVSEGGSTLNINQGALYGLVFDVDVMVFELYSILDYFALELAEIFGLKVQKKTGEEGTVESFWELKKVEGLEGRIASKVRDLIKQPWFNYFQHLRHRVTHRLPVEVALQVGKFDATSVPFMPALLPDDPNLIVPTFDLKLDPATEAKKWLEGILSFVDSVCGDLVTTFASSVGS